MLLQSNMVKRITASGGGDLEAKTGESLRIKRIECIPSASDTYLTIMIDRVTVAFYRVKGKSGNHLSTIRSSYLKRNIMDFLTERNINVTIPIAEGQTLTVKRYAQDGNVMIIYDRFSAGDVKASDPNGSESKVYTFLQYAKVGATPAASGDFLIDTALTPAEFPDFPCAKVVPALHMIELLGIAASPFVDAAGGGIGFETTFLKFIKDREVLFDPDRNGIPFKGLSASEQSLYYGCEYSLIGSGTEIILDDINNIVSAHGDPLMFEPALKFEAGQELNVYLTVLRTGAGTWTGNVDDQAFILRVRRQ